MERTMEYDLEKYRTKREKVLGVKKRFFSLGRLLTIFSVAVVVLVSAAVLPQMAAFLKNRHLDDIIYRLKDDTVLTPDTIAAITAIKGVTGVNRDSENQRLILTFNREQTKPHAVTNQLSQVATGIIQLNVISHRQRLANLKKEKEFEAL